MSKFTVTLELSFTRHYTISAKSLSEAREKAIERATRSIASDIHIKAISYNTSYGRERKIYPK